MLSKDDILNRRVKMEVVDVPDFGNVGIRVMGMSDLFKWEDQRTDADPKMIYAQLLAKTICDENGKRLFTDEDWDGISELPLPVLSCLFDHALRINKMDKGSTEENAKKN